MKLVMKILFFIFIMTIITYLSIIDFLGPKISIEEGKTLEFSIGQEVDDWSQYFELYDATEGALDDKYMTINSDTINMDKPGVQYIYVTAVDKAGNKSSHSFEVKISSGYTNFDFENFVNNAPITADLTQLDELTYSSAPEGIDATNSNATISKYLGSQGLEVTIDGSDKTSGIKIPLSTEKHQKYYLKYDINIDQNGHPNDVYIPTLSNTKQDRSPVQLAITSNNQLKVIDNINHQSYVVKNSNLSEGINTIELEFAIEDQLGEPDYVSIKLNNKQVYAIDNIDLGFGQVNQVLLSVYSDAKEDQNTKVYIDNFKFSMVENELLG